MVGLKLSIANNVAVERQNGIIYLRVLWVLLDIITYKLLFSLLSVQHSDPEHYF